MNYYATYSMMTDKGTATGRVMFDCKYPMDSAARIVEAEAAILKHVQETSEPSARNLFFTWWTPLTGV